MNAITVLNEADRQQIEQAIAQAEQDTSAEIICAVTTESGRYDRAEAIIGLIVAVLALGLAHGLHAWATSSVGDWAATPLHLGWQVLAVVAGFVAGNLFASYVHPLRRLVVSEKEMEAEVRRAAVHTFALASVARTVSRTGLLIYVSLFERRVVILPDEQVRQALGDETIAHLRDQAVEDLKQGRFTQTFLDLVQKVRPRLSEALPADREVNADELTDRVLRFHPRPVANG